MNRIADLQASSPAMLHESAGNKKPPGFWPGGWDFVVAFYFACSAIPSARGRKKVKNQK
jgi:hypothetical protein